MNPDVLRFAPLLCIRCGGRIVERQQSLPWEWRVPESFRHVCANCDPNDFIAGIRLPDNTALVITRNGKPLPRRGDLADHSPTGFEWGYGGSGPAQLALAILAYSTQRPATTLGLYQKFKWTFVGWLQQEDWWTITVPRVNGWVAVTMRANGGAE